MRTEPARWRPFVSAGYWNKNWSQDMDSRTILPMCTTFDRVPFRMSISYNTRASVKSSVITSLLRQANYSVRILKAIWEAVQMACSTAGKNQDVDNAFESLSDLLRGYSNKGFVLSIEGFVVFSTPYAVYLLILCSLEQAKRRDEQTLKLFGHFSAKYDRNKVARLICGLLYINGPLSQ